MRKIPPEEFGCAAFSVQNRAGRLLWAIVYGLLVRPSPRPFHSWRCFVLRLFRAQIGKGARVYPKARIWAPWNLKLGLLSAIADDAELYNPSMISIGDYAVISQGAYLCGASHAYREWAFPLISKPITIHPHAWIAARAIVQMGVTIGEGTIIGAGSIVTRDMPAWTVCAGNPCRPIKPYEKS